MRHTRDEVIERTTREFALLDALVTALAAEDWARSVPRPETKDPWTIKDALAHITHWKAEVVRSARRQRRPAEERALGTTEINRLVYLRWRERPPEEIVVWHRQVQADVQALLRDAPEAWFCGRERRQPGPSTSTATRPSTASRTSSARSPRHRRADWKSPDLEVHTGLPEVGAGGSPRCRWARAWQHPVLPVVSGM